MRSNELQFTQGDQARTLEYNLNVEPIEYVSIMKTMGNTIKWPQKNNNLDPKRDVTKYCEFHGDYGHSTPDYIALRFKATNLLKKGHFQDLISDTPRRPAYRAHP